MQAMHEEAMKEMVELAARFGNNWGLVFDYTECFRQDQWGSVSEQKRLRLLKEIWKLFETCEFEIDGKKYRTDRPRIIAAIRIVVDLEKYKFKNHNYLKRVLLGEKAERVSAEGLTAHEETEREIKRRDHDNHQFMDEDISAQEFKERHEIKSLVDQIVNKG